MPNVIESSIKKCKNCGGNLVFSPSLQALKCEKCGSKNEITKNSNIVKHDITEKNEKVKTNKNITVRCESCGANVIVTNNAHASNCSYCGSSVVLHTDDMLGLKPDGIIPFAFDKNRASVLFKQNIKHRWFLPNKFKKTPPIDSIKGVYIPSFGFDEITSSNYQGRLGTNHTRRGANGKTYTYTTYQNISGAIRLEHNNVFIESSSLVSQAQLEEIKPYDTRQIYKYNADFIRGYSLEYYINTVEQCKLQADFIIDNSIRSSILSKYSYDTVSYLNINTDRLDEKFSYVILPTYQVSYNYKNKNYITLMNGQTGTVGKNLPKSGVKIGFFTAGIILFVLFIIITIIMFSN